MTPPARRSTGPAQFASCATVATIVLLGWKLQYATVLALNICLGIAVDDTVHFLSRYRDDVRKTGNRIEAVRLSFRSSFAAK